MDLSKKLRGRAKPKVLAEQISDILTEMILDGTLEPGERLVEVKLQEHLGVSRSPLREALRQLETKGLVRVVPRKGTYVNEITSRNVRENFPVRACLEGLAAREACGRLTVAQLALMEQALAAMEVACETKDSALYRTSHARFHEVFIEASDNELLIELLRTLRLHRLWYFVSFRYHRMNLDNAIRIHKEILDLFSAPDTDPDQVEKVVRNHLETALPLLFGGDLERLPAGQLPISDPD